MKDIGYDPAKDLQPVALAALSPLALVVQGTAPYSTRPVVAACQAMRGVSFLVAVTFVAEIGDVRRFERPRQLMAFSGAGPFRALDRRYSPAGRPHLGR